MRRDDVGHNSRDRLARKSKPRLEGLEDRKLLYSTTGGLWSHPERVTFSLVPDGTNIGGSSSALYSTLNSQYSGWQAVFNQAAAIWEAVANVNLVQVSDNGAAMGSGTYQQGDPNMGDIRISAISLASNVLATTMLPPALNGGSNAGDIVFNKNINWTKGTGYDLLTVAVHEFGHALGMGHSLITSAEMYANYTTTKSALVADDINGAVAIYTARQPDAWTQTYHNTTMANAPDISSMIDSSTGQAELDSLNIVNASTANWFKVVVPSYSASTATFTMQSTNLSELSPRIQVYNSAGTSLGYAYVTSAYGATVSFSLGGISPGQTYYIKAMAAGAGPTGAGGYGLQLNFGTQTQAPIDPPNTIVAATADQAAGSIGSAPGWGPPGRTIYVPEQTTVGDITGWGDSLSIGKVHPRVSHSHPRGPVNQGHGHGHVKKHH